MNFKEWINEMAHFTLRSGEPIQVMVGDTPSGPFHVESFQATGIDMRFEDYAIEGARPPQGNWVAPLADGKFIVYTAMKPHQTFVSDQPGVPGPDGRMATYPVIRQDWARFAEIFGPGFAVIKPAMYDRGMDGVVKNKPSTVIPINPQQPIAPKMPGSQQPQPDTQNPSRLQSA